MAKTRKERGYEAVDVSVSAAEVEAAKRRAELAAIKQVNEGVDKKHKKLNKLNKCAKKEKRDYNIA